MLEIFQIIFGSIFVLFLPGFALSWAFFPKKDEVDWIERIALSFGLSIALVPLSVFYLNFLFHVPINLVNVSVVILVLIAVGYVGYKQRTERILSKCMERFKFPGRLKRK
ncbi:MAG: DUF1616 domain-containing protein [Candidatus Aenigmarchaeota archaeon]|nr:DUF1616 domain-containing protein [Candidatus Aenigmarchaeota archaeon]